MGAAVTTAELLTKTCPGCKETKPVNEFTRNRARYDGLQPYCKVCSKADQAKYYHSNQAKIVAQKARVASGKQRQNPCCQCVIQTGHPAVRAIYARPAPLTGSRYVVQQQS
jgi:hypothetical protein